MNVIGLLSHLCALPSADLVLLSANTATAILVNGLLAIYFLGEKFIFRYDLVAWFLIIAGNVLILLRSSKVERSYSPEEIVQILSSTKVIVFFSFIFAFLIFGLTLMARVNRALNKF